VILIFTYCFRVPRHRTWASEATLSILHAFHSSDESVILLSVIAWEHLKRSLLIYASRAFRRRTKALKYKSGHRADSYLRVFAFFVIERKHFCALLPSNRSVEAGSAVERIPSYDLQGFSLNETTTTAANRPSSGFLPTIYALSVIERKHTNSNRSDLYITDHTASAHTNLDLPSANSSFLRGTEPTRFQSSDESTRINNRSDF